MPRVSTLAFLLFSIIASVRADVKQLTAKTIDVKNDHSKTPTVQTTYKHRYLYNIEDYDKVKGPVLFYAGGEGDIADIADKQKLFRTLAQNLTAAIVFAEHRYYGESFPAGSKTALSLDNLKYLTVENVLADYVDVINDFRANVGTNANAPVIVYGSKYAGLLAAWLKVQNDKLVTGAIASSAPVLDFDTNTDAMGRPALGDYDKRITKIYTDAGCDFKALRQGFSQLDNANSDDLNAFFRLSPATTAENKDEAKPKVRYLARQALYAMAENNYPYAAKTGPNGRELVAYPVQEACKSLKTASAKVEGSDDLKNLALAIGVYYGTKENIVIKPGDTGYIAGTVQPIDAEAYEHCTGAALYRCPMGDANDFFPKAVYCKANTEFPSKVDAQCTDWLTSINFNKKIDTTWISDNLGFEYATKNKIVFVTGSVDPNAGGVYSPKDANADAKNGIYAYQPEQGTTGHDLLEPNTCDPNTVKNARYQIVKIVKCWSGLLTTADCAPENLQNDLPSYDSTKPSTCVAEAYPWGQADVPPGGTAPPQKVPTSTPGGASAASFSALAIVGSFFMAAMLR